ncbi:DUF2924 domain-containing protein [Sphingobium sp. AN641]|uniref:DUF2924 domain-containing protein n=1 Tax=Sphingobium sp. AN641 TaxID=3133443 RepID=UPI0030BA54DD
MAKIADRLAALSTMPAAQLRLEWERVYDSPAPTISDELLRHGIAYRIQGGSTRAAAGAPRGSGKAPRQVLKPGTQLIRSWNGRTISVTVEDDGFLYEGQRLASLSAIARLVTGTSWSGPRFFGLKDLGTRG